jgi:hypothetical protein
MDVFRQEGGNPEYDPTLSSDPRPEFQNTNNATSLNPSPDALMTDDFAKNRFGDRPRDRSGDRPRDRPRDRSRDREKAKPSNEEPLSRANTLDQCLPDRKVSGGIVYDSDEDGNLYPKTIAGYHPVRGGFQIFWKYKIPGYKKPAWEITPASYDKEAFERYRNLDDSVMIIHKDLKFLHGLCAVSRLGGVASVKQIDGDYIRSARTSLLYYNSDLEKRPGEDQAF